MSKAKALKEIEELKALIRSKKSLTKALLSGIAQRIEDEVSDVNPQECNYCNGSGECQECNGDGQCHNCNGSGEES